MDKDQFVSIKELAELLGLDRSNTRKCVKKLGYEFHKRRTADSRSQLTLCLTKTEADEILAKRAEAGYLRSSAITSGDVGFFYVIQLVPELDPKRVKLGFAENVEQRLSQHRTAAPTAKLLKSWPCRKVWEQTAIDALTRDGCRLILNEVFECDDQESVIQRGNVFFASLPRRIRG